MNQWTVDTPFHGSKLLVYLQYQMGTHASARSIKRAIESNCCRVNGKIQSFASSLVAQGDVVQFFFNQKISNRHKRPVFHPSKIIYEDNDLLIYNKPPGLNCDENGATKMVRPYSQSLQLIHRLDRETTGALLFSKNSETHAMMLELFKQRQIKKCYRTIVDGEIKHKAGLIHNFLAKKMALQGQSIWGVVKEGGLEAITRWNRLAVSHQEHATLLQCFPETGRTHQIRVHLAEIGHPIIGDTQYGKKFRCPLHQSHYLLHAENLEFYHPKTGVKLSIHVPPPIEFSHIEMKLFGRQFLSESPHAHFNC